MKIISFLLLTFCFINTSNGNNVFYWKWQQEEGKIKVTGHLNNEAATTIYCDITDTKKRFALLYRVIDEIEYSRLSLYKKTVDTLSHLLVAPFNAGITVSESIEIEIDSSLLNFPIEFLQVNKQPIGIFCPLLYKIVGAEEQNGSDSIDLHRGFIVRDPTSDPENACINIFHHYPQSVFKSAYKITNKDLGFKANTDFILISAHGEVDSVTFRGGFALNKIDKVSPLFLKINNSTLVYIDGCQQGINWAYISALASTGEVNYYTGPIISNDSGESSTKTINWFFAFLKKNHNPAFSMWLTRKKLYHHYNKKIRAMDVINKSFIFRMYKV